jgi:hypothetical protein
MEHNQLTKNELNKKNRWTEIKLNDLKKDDFYAILYPGEPVHIILRIITKIKYDDLKNKTGVNYIELKPIDENWATGVFPGGGLNSLKFYKAREAWKVYDLAVQAMTDEKRWANEITKHTGRIPGHKNSKTATLGLREMTDNIGSYLGGKTKKKKRKKTINSRRRT